MYPTIQEYDLPREIAESTVRSLAEQLPDEVVCFTQVRLLDQHGKHREIDLLVAWPGLGLAAVEVKGGDVTVADGEWFSRSAGGRVHRIKDPVRQAEQAMWALKTYVTSRPSWGDIWPPAVVPVAALPWSGFPTDFRTPGAVHEQFLDRDACSDSAAFGEALRAALEATRPQMHEVITALQVDLLIDLLEVSLPSQADMSALLREHEAVINLLTRNQYDTLERIRTNDRIIVNGGPGTGKTWLALEHARREARRGAKVALVCYSRGLAEHLRGVVDAWDPAERPDYVGTFHYLAEVWSGAEPGGDSSYYAALPGLLAEAAEGRAPEDRYDLLVVDEAQDFQDDWWTPLLATLGDPQEGPVVVFQDDLQRVFAGRGHIPFAGTEVELAENLRNSQEIVATLHELHGRPVLARGPDGPPVRFVVSTDATATTDADRAVERLLDEGFAQESIAVLTTYRRHPAHTQLLETRGAAGYWATFADPAPFHCTVQSFKGLERPAVVLAVNGFNFDAVEREILNVGMSRARSLLVVVADPATVAAVDGGADLLAHLENLRWSI